MVVAPMTFGFISCSGESSMIGCWSTNFSLALRATRLVSILIVGVFAFIEERIE